MTHGICWDLSCFQGFEISKPKSENGKVHWFGPLMRGFQVGWGWTCGRYISWNYRKNWKERGLVCCLRYVVASFVRAAISARRSTAFMSLWGTEGRDLWCVCAGMLWRELRRDVFCSAKFYISGFQIPSRFVISGMRGGRLVWLVFHSLVGPCLGVCRATSPVGASVKVFCGCHG